MLVMMTNVSTMEEQLVNLTKLVEGLVEWNQQRDATIAQMLHDVAEKKSIYHFVCNANHNDECFMMEEQLENLIKLVQGLIEGFRQRDTIISRLL